MNKTIGTCSLCGGAVTVPRYFMSVFPPTPRCESCGATAKPSRPVIDMEPPRRVAIDRDGSMRGTDGVWRLP